MEPIRLAILGATGMAGRDALRHQQWLSEKERQYAEITYVTAGPTSVGRPLRARYEELEAALAKAYPDIWEAQSFPSSLDHLTIQEMDPDQIAMHADYAISALDSEVARTIEPELARRGVHVFSNSSAYRWDPQVPLLVPEVNYNHLPPVKKQETSGKRICNPNCTTAGFIPIVWAFRQVGCTIASINLTTFQSLSGKGDAIADPEYVARASSPVWVDWKPRDDRPGMNEEEWKSSYEPQKILGRIGTMEELDAGIRAQELGQSSSLLPISSRTHRIRQSYGHLERVDIQFKSATFVDEAIRVLRECKIPEEVAFLPTTPTWLFYVTKGKPSYEKNLLAGGGMSITVGDIQQVGEHTLRMWSLSHNLRRGATWAGRQGLELFLSQHVDDWNEFFHRLRQNR